MTCKECGLEAGDGAQHTTERECLAALRAHVAACVLCRDAQEKAKEEATRRAAARETRRRLEGRANTEVPPPTDIMSG